MDNDFKDRDLLVIDRSLEWEENKIALCYVDGAFTLKRIKINNGKCFLVLSNYDGCVIARSNEAKKLGVPISIGIAATKALAKAANRIAKKFPERTEGCHVIDREI